jgi:hypothetical protein
LSGKFFFTLILEAILRENFSPEKFFSNIFGTNKRKKYGKIMEKLQNYGTVVILD